MQKSPSELNLASGTNGNSGTEVLKPSININQYAHPSIDLEEFQRLKHLESIDNDTGKSRLPPHSLIAENAVLGALLQDNMFMENIQDILCENDFYFTCNRTIFSIIQLLHRKQSPFDFLLVYEQLGLHDRTNVTLEKLQQITQNTPNLTHTKMYANVVRQRAILRELIYVANDIANKAFLATADESVTPLLDEAERRILAINESRVRTAGGFVDFSSTLENVFLSMEAQYNSVRVAKETGQQPSMSGVSTGFTDLDECTSGFQKGDLIIIAARPSMGKTAFSVNIAEYVAIHEKLPVAIFSMEMSAAQLAMRILCSQSEVQQQKMKTGNIELDDWPKISNTMQKVRDAPIFIDETAALTPHELRSRARRLSKKQGVLGLIIVDYLQLMSGSNARSHENRATEISEISRSLKSLAKEMDCPVVALSQLNRSVEQRPNKMPMLSDLRESGAIEQDADLILFIYRDEIYNPDSERKGTADIKIGKQRNGAAGNTITLAFQGHYSRFRNYAKSNNSHDPVFSYD